MIWLGIGVGSPLLGCFSDLIENRRLALMLSAALGLFASLVLLYLPELTYQWSYVVCFVLGLGAGAVWTVSFCCSKRE